MTRLRKELTRLHRDDPADRAILYALVDMLGQVGKTQQAEDILAAAAKRSRYDIDMTRRLFRIYDARDDASAAAALLIEALAARPDALRDLAPMWSDLLRPWRAQPFERCADPTIQVPPHAQASRLSGRRSSRRCGIGTVLAAHLARSRGQAGAAVRASISLDDQPLLGPR
jgi:hypothetical protein